MIDAIGSTPDPENSFLAAEQARIAELRRIAFAIEDALTETPRGVNLQRPIALFVKRALFDFADQSELDT